jgi:hypothetical protein
MRGGRWWGERGEREGARAAPRATEHCSKKEKNDRGTLFPSPHTARDSQGLRVSSRPRAHAHSAQPLGVWRGSEACFFFVPSRPRRISFFAFRTPHTRTPCRAKSSRSKSASAVTRSAPSSGARCEGGVGCVWREEGRARRTHSSAGTVRACKPDAFEKDARPYGALPWTGGHLVEHVCRLDSACACGGGRTKKEKKKNSPSLARGPLPLTLSHPPSKQTRQLCSEHGIGPDGLLVDGAGAEVRTRDGGEEKRRT